MSTPKIILYYVLTPLADPEAIRLWQKSLCEKLNLKGRILISKHGINGTLGGEMANIKQYVRQFKSYPPFKRVDMKWSDGKGDDFPRLSVKVRDEIVTFGAPEELEVDDKGVVGGGVHLKPQQLHKLLAEKGDEVVFFDGRNAFEAEIGKMKDAIVPPVRTTRDFIPLFESGKYDNLKDKPIVTYCTGGIRCEILTSLMKQRGFKEVYQMDGGIVRYGETYGDAGLWEGSLFVFDNRMHMEFSDDTKVISKCTGCDKPTTHMANYPDPNGRQLIVICEECVANQVELDKEKIATAAAKASF